MTRIGDPLPPPVSLELTRAQEEIVEIEKRVRDRAVAYSARLAVLRTAANEDPSKAAILLRRSAAAYRAHHAANLADLIQLGNCSAAPLIPRLRTFESKEEIGSKLHSVIQEQYGIVLFHQRFTFGHVSRSARIAFEIYRITCAHIRSALLK